NKNVYFSKPVESLIKTNVRNSIQASLKDSPDSSETVLLNNRINKKTVEYFDSSFKVKVDNKFINKLKNEPSGHGIGQSTTSKYRLLPESVLDYQGIYIDNLEINI